ncbi:MAG: tetratricopeptide repeat protein [Deltaproteobacteria bacterium]|nr:tetratricopeptide repeat protein [Deltaproteobacteria bacterium]
MLLIARYNLVRAYLNKNDYNNAILQLKTIIEQSPKEEKAYNILGIIYWTLGQYKLAETAFKKALEIKSDYKMAQLNLAHLYVEEAIKQYKKLYLLNPQDEEIKEEYKCILKVNKRDANAHFLLGRLYPKGGKFK